MGISPVPSLHVRTLQPRRLPAWLLPEEQRRARAEISAALDISARSSQTSAFWAMLALSAVIATAGVIADSTATVIGAMIIAPLATPIMGVALSLVLRDRLLNRRSLRVVVLGLLLVVGIGVVGALFLPATFDLLANGQVTSRTSPTLVDLVAAVATGLVGAIGLARRDVSDVLPGVAVAISLVPPLAVSGVCLGQGSAGLAAGAFILFLSNVLAMILAGTAVFAVAYRAEVVGEAAGSNRRAYATLTGLVVLVVLVLAANTFLTIATGIIDRRVKTAAESWIAETPGAEVRDVELVGSSIVIHLVSDADPPPASALRLLLDGKVPDTFDIVVDVTRGERIDVGPLDAPNPAN